MAFSILELARSGLADVARDAGERVRVGLAKWVLAGVGLALLLSAGLVALAELVGYPVAATAFALVLGLAALVVHLLGRRSAARRSRRTVQAQDRVQADIALALSAARVVRPLLPVVAFLAAFTCARRW
jgi:hypothetical protein